MPNKKQGFTIIEVVLVLAIAAMIFVVVLVAVPQLQKSRRDAQRKSDTASILAALSKQAANNRNVFSDPADFANTGPNSFFDTYFQGEIRDPGGDDYRNIINAADPTVPGFLTYRTADTCETPPAGLTLGNQTVSLTMILETGTYCVDNT